MSSPSLVKVCLGTMEFGRYASEEQAQRMVQAFVSAGFSELDTASMYCAGESERIIGRLPPSLSSSLVVHSKANPWNTDKERKGLTRTSVLTQCAASLESLGRPADPSSPPFDIYYLHAPDHGTPILETLTAVDELYRRGVFRRFGLSNYSSWQVVEIHHLCTQRGFVMPSVYQGMLNPLTRLVQSELLPALRHLSMSFYAYNPLAGGLLSGSTASRRRPPPPAATAGNEWADRYRERFWKKRNFDAIDAIQAALRPLQPPVTLAEASLRWMRHHSGLSGEHGDCVILGASNEAHVEANLRGVEGGPLDNAVVEAFERAWAECKADCPPYFR